MRISLFQRRQTLCRIALACSILVFSTTLNAAVDRLTAYHAEELAITNDSGVRVPLLSAEAYHAEFNYLRRVLRETDLNGPPVETDGWTYNIAEAEWPLMAFAYFGYACINLSKASPDLREPALAEARWLIEAIQSRRISGFMAPHFGAPFDPTNTTPAVFVHGHWLQLATRYRRATGDGRYDATIHRIARVLADGFATNEQGLLKSYPTMWWVSDNCPAHSALRCYDQLFQRDLSSVRRKFIKSLQGSYLDPSTGLLATYVDADKRAIVQGPRGISTMYGLHFLKDIEPGFARQQYSLATEHLIRILFGVAAVREFPEGARDYADIDSGPVIFGLGPSASGFAIAASATMGDNETAWRLVKAAVITGLPLWRKGELQYTLMPPVGQAVILFGKTILIGR